MATRAAKTTIKWEDLADFDESKNILLVGDSGAGKTVLAGGAPKLLFLSTENGTISAKRQGSKAKMRRITTWSQLEEALDTLDKELDAGKCQFEWVCLDSLPKMQTLLRQHLLKIGMDENRKGADLDSLQLQDYNKWYNMFLRFVDRMVDMPINVIFTSTSMRIEVDDDDSLPQDIVYPAIQGKAKEGYAMAQQVCAAMSSVWFLNVEGKGSKRVRALYTQKTLPFFAKCRYGVLPARLVLAPNDTTTMMRLITKIEDGAVLEETIPEPGDLELDGEPESEEEEFDLEEPTSVAKRSARSTPPKSAAKAATAKSGTRRAKPEPVEEDLDDELSDDEDDDTY